MCVGIFSIWPSIDVLSLLTIMTIIIYLGLEFIYAQSPDSMKGLLTGLFYFVFGVFAAVGITIFFKLNSSVVHLFYTILSVSMVGFLLYVLGAVLYRNRERPTNDESEEDLLRRTIAANVYQARQY